MKTAVNAQGELIEADCAAESQAACPFCDGRVVLRRHRVMGGQYVAYWRHLDNRNATCPGRSRRVTGKTGGRRQVPWS